MLTLRTLVFYLWMFDIWPFDIPSFVPLNSVPAALRRPRKKQKNVLDFQHMSYLTDPPNSSSRPSQSSPRPSQSLFWARPGPGGDLGGSRGSPNSPLSKKSYVLAEMELIPGSSGSARSARSGVRSCDSGPPFHARRGSG